MNAARQKYAFEVILSNINEDVRTGKNHSWLLSNKPLNTNGGDLTRKEAWEALIEVIKNHSLQIALTNEGIWLSSSPESLSEKRNTPVLILRPCVDIPLLHPLANFYLHFSRALAAWRHEPNSLALLDKVIRTLEGYRDELVARQRTKYRAGAGVKVWRAGKLLGIGKIVKEGNIDTPYMVGFSGPIISLQNDSVIDYQGIPQPVNEAWLSTLTVQEHR